MKKLCLLIFFFPLISVAQKVTLVPTISPALFKSGDQITVTYDVTGTSLASLTSAWAWVWIPGATMNAKYNIEPATSGADPAKFTKSVANGRTLFTLIFKPSDFFTQDISTQTKMGILLKANTWSNGQTTDYLANFWDGSFQLKLTSPMQRPLFVDNGEQILIQAETPIAANYELFINNSSVDIQNSSTNYSFTHTVTQTSGYSTVKLVATQGVNSSEVSFQYIISINSPVMARPVGIKPGINYYPTDQSKATVCLWAPGKSSCYVVGDFSNWDVTSDYLMKKDGEYFWFEITGLASGTEYAFQYLIDESIYVADPYADKILDPDDQYIPVSTYPGLKSYPEKAVHADWYFNRLSVLQTGQQVYTWSVTDFQKPAKDELVIYELLIRDFFGSGSRNFQNLIDTISYFKRLGVNAIELMPIMEFNGNESWGYNPAFMFAPDKYYGTKNKFKEFIDKCHQNGIAVILDIAMNHQDMPNSYVMMDFDFVTGKPEADNKWFNVTARHPFNVFFDMNHESAYTKKYLDTVNHYWLNEFKVDGFRFDLSKGFTQQNNPNNVDAWSAYDASRIAILKRMADKIWEHTPDAYVILEHLSVNSEEKELAEYRAAEGKGMMLWGKMTDQYNQNTMGYAENNDISGVYHTSRGWTVPHLVSYMESHDEERLMYKNEVFGSISGSYSVKDTLTALSRVRAASTIFYTIPGPKMLWQFGELGYDKSINHCPDGTNNPDCRVSPKPVRWEYQENSHRQWLYNHIADLNRLRKTYDVFTDGTVTISTGNSLTKQAVLKNNPYNANPLNADDMNAVVAVNFDLVSKNIFVEFPHSGIWYDYYAGGSAITVTASSASVSFVPGGYKLYTDVPIETLVITDVELRPENSIDIFPNPVEGKLIAKNEISPIWSLVVYSNQGKQFTPVRLSVDSWDVADLHPGLFIVEIKTNKGLYRTKIIKR